jgi:hypothetical protein
VFLIGTKCRCGLGVQHAIDRTSVHPFGPQALLQQLDLILDAELPLLWALLARRLRPRCPRQPRPRRPRRPGLSHDGTHPQDADDQHGHQHVHRVSSSVLTGLVSFGGFSAYV